MTRTIFKQLSAVQADLAKRGISKDQTNKFDKYKYRGIDDVLNALSPILAEHGVLIMPSVSSSETRQVPTSKGGVQNHSKVTIEYHLYDVDGDAIAHVAVGEAFDRGDKSINKAQTAAFKYFLFQAFCIPLQGDDADNESHEIVDPSITEEQRAGLVQLLADTGTDPGQFCNWLGVEALEFMPLSILDKATGALMAKKAKLEASNGQ